jgi:hypothetical protein
MRKERKPYPTLEFDWKVEVPVWCVTAAIVLAVIIYVKYLR